MNNNLGGYKIMTILAKKVHGPLNLLLLTMGTGYIIIRPFEALIKGGVKKVSKKQFEPEKLNTNLIFEVTSYGESEEGLKLNIGDKYRVLESDGEPILIEKIGDSNNPYFVSADFLRSISDFC